MASSTFTTLQHQEPRFSVPPCKLPSPLHPFNFHSSCKPLCSNHTQHQKTPYPRARFSAAITPKLSTRDPETSREAFVLEHAGETGSGVGSFASQDKSNGRNSVSPLSSIPRVGESAKKMSVNGATARKSRKKWFSWSRDETLVAKSSASVDSSVDKEVYERNEGGNSAMGKRRIGKWSKKVKALKPVGGLKYQLDKCAEKGRLMGAIELYEKALKDGMKMRPYYYTVLLDLCSFAAVGVIRPPKSWSGSRNPNLLTAPAEGLILNSNAMVYSLNKADNSNGSAKSPLPSDKKWTDSSVRHRSSDNSELTCTGRFDGLDDNFDEGKPALSSNGLLKPNTLSLDGIDHGEMNSRDNICTSGERSSNQEKIEIQVTENFKNYALQKGFQIYEKMCLDEVPLNEATLTALARMAMSMGNGDMAFDAVKQIAGLGIKPTLRSYEPALSTYCNNGDIEKAFAVEKHMLDHGVCPEEPELEALLRVSIGASKADKVYYLLHKLRTTVRKVSPSTADVIVRWFESKASSRVGKRKVDQRLMREAIQNRGGGWHGKGWLGKGKWAVSRSTVGADALCKCCGEKLAFTDLDPVETEMFSESEKFAESVASMAIWREKNSNFLKFQKWLEDHGPFEVVIDGANVGYSDQRVFEPYKINAVVNEIRQSLPSRKWPLIVLNNKRITGHKLGKPVNRLYVHMWRNADALYTTPTGSNDDWYWLYAAIKFKCLLVTNDEMKDHMFQLLGNDFFPKWKERHQVHFSFPGASPVLHMPPPCSVVIQESENGCWHIPIGSEDGYISETTWLCITRTRSDTRRQDSATIPEGVQLKHAAIPTVAQAEATMESPAKNGLNHEKQRRPTEEVHKSVRDIVSVIMSFDHRTTTLSKIEAAERNGGCVIDFQI